MEEALGATARLNTVEAAKFVGRTKSCLEKWRAFPDRGGPPWLKLGRGVAYERADLEAWLTDCKRGVRS